MLNPDMPAQQLRMHMGEMTAQEMRTARAAIRWANEKAVDEIERLRAEVEKLRPWWPDQDQPGTFTTRLRRLER